MAEKSGILPELAKSGMLGGMPLEAEKSGILPELANQPIPQPVALRSVTSQFNATHPSKMEPSGLEPPTPWLQTRCSPD
jgi:hypothetical protein